ncbi:MAG: AbrB/MazE/SpoVT family DNA-binding domain-containing protein [Oscillospiraceae bacterium]|jgi:antitoxin MazE|nr:AbrB/MazE/SpoVT family DNA-binding domain-containing protein [Oscillospiraceae bacterium]
MKTTIAKWGNSNAVRLPKALTDALDLHENDTVQIEVKGREIVIKKPYPTLKELFENYDGDYVCEEWDTGTPRGDEVF